MSKTKTLDQALRAEYDVDLVIHEKTGLTFEDFKADRLAEINKPGIDPQTTMAGLDASVEWDSMSSTDREINVKCGLDREAWIKSRSEEIDAENQEA